MSRLKVTLALSKLCVICCAVLLAGCASSQSPAGISLEEHVGALPELPEGPGGEFSLAVLRDTSGAPLGVRVTWPRVDDPTVLGYYIYRSTTDLTLSGGQDPAGDDEFRVNGGNRIDQSGSGIDELLFDDDFIAEFGTEYWYWLTVVNDTDDESDYSIEEKITIASPVITSVSQAGGSIGDAVTITGEWFGDIQDGDTVYFTDSAGDTVVAATDYVSWSMTEIVVEIPYGAADGPVAVDISGTQALSVDPELVDYSEPVLTTVAPVEDFVQNGYITLTGTDFGPKPSTVGDQTKIYFGTVPAQPADIDETLWTTTTIKVKVPAAASGSLVQVHVDLAGNLSGDRPFTLLPHINSLSATSGATGAAVTLTGTNFGSTQGSGSVTVSGVSATVTAWANGSVAITIPPMAVDGSVVLTRQDGKVTNGLAFDVVPTILSFTPSRRLVGEQITITGSGFGPVRGTSKVTFMGGGVDAVTYGAWSSGSIVVTVPAGAVKGKIRVSIVDASAGANIDSVLSVADLSVLLPPTVITDIGQVQ